MHAWPFGSMKKYICIVAQSNLGVLFSPPLTLVRVHILFCGCLRQEDAKEEIRLIFLSKRSSYETGHKKEERLVVSVKSLACVGICRCRVYVILGRDADACATKLRPCSVSRVLQK